MRHRKPYGSGRRSSRQTLTLFSLLLSFLAISVIATPATLPFTECTAGNAIDPSLKINVSTVYGQIVTDDALGRHLNLTVIGNTGQEITPISNATDLLCASLTIDFSVIERSKLTVIT